jgi:adenylyltransferase/sulfurtransferase
MSRYSRQELFPPIGKEGQVKIRASSIAIVGCGALGSLQAEVAARAGIGKILIVDRDFVEPVNLQRQSLFTEDDARRSMPKAVAAAEHLRGINSEVEIVPHVADLNPDTVSLLSGSQMILDGTDNFQTRYLLNDVAWLKGIPWVYGACVASSGVAAAFVPPDFPCFRCLFESEPPPGTAQTCDTAGIVWPAVAAVVSYQTTAMLKILTGHVLQPKMLHLDVWEDQFHVVSLSKAKRNGCATCGLRAFPSLESSSSHETSLCGRDAVQVKPRVRAQLDLDILSAQWSKLGETYRNPFLAKLKTADWEIVLFPDGRALIKGTSDPVRARDLYAKYVGS